MRKTHLQNQSNWNISDKVHQLSGGNLEDDNGRKYLLQL